MILMVVATVVMWADLVGLGAHGSWLFCIGGALATILMDLSGVVAGFGGMVVLRTYFV